MKVFNETQGFNQWWFRGILLLITAVIIIAMFFVLRDLPSPEPYALWIAIGSSVIAIALLIGIGFFFKLHTRIDEFGIYYQFYPFQRSKKLIPWSTIQDCFVRQYKPIREYGGWGNRVKLGRNEKAYNVRGNIGIQIVFKSGKRLLIGTQQEDAAKRVLATYKHKYSTL